jgi:hypothetical protein
VLDASVFKAGKIKNFLKKRLTDSQKRIVRRAAGVLDSWIGTLLSFKLILVFGCQRSGTTLVYMLLTAHPMINGKDESECNFSFPKGSELLINYLHGKMTCFKLPTRTSELDLIIRKFQP